MDKIWAVAHQTLRQAMRMKIALSVILLLLILLPVMVVSLGGDGTLLGKLQTFSSYGLSLVNVLLSVMTVAVSCYCLSSELKRKQLFLVVTKPIRRWQILLGKFLGVAILNMFLLVIFSGAVYGLTRLVPRLGEYSDSDIQKASEQFFTARVGLKNKVDEEGLVKVALEQYKKMEEEGRLPESVDQRTIVNELIGQERMRQKSVLSGTAKQWDFSDIRVSDPNARVFIRYKLEASIDPPDGKIYGLWSVGDLRQLELGPGQLTTPIYNLQQDAATRTYFEFSVPADAVAQDGFMSVGFFNSPALNSTTVIPQELEVLYQAGTFTDNYARAVLLILVRLLFLSALGIVLTTWLSFPVAVLVCFTALAVGLCNGFIVESIDSLGITLGLIYSFTIKPILSLLPQFDGPFNPSGYIVSGRLVNWIFILRAVLETLAAKAGILMCLGMLIFRRREVARSEV